MADINVSGTLNTVAVDPTAGKPVVARASQIYDNAKGMSQDEINLMAGSVNVSVDGEVLHISSNVVIDGIEAALSQI